MSLDNALWHYAVHIYSQPQVESVCLQLQRHYGLSVNRLLFALWLAGEGRRLALDVLADSRLQQWSSEMLLPLRALRYSLRPERDDAALAHCYRALQQAELEAEKVELARLFALAGDGCPGAALSYRDLANANLQSYLKHSGVVVDAKLQALLGQLLMAVLPAAPA